MSIGRLFREADRDLQILLVAGAVLYAADLAGGAVASGFLLAVPPLVWRFALPRPLPFMGLSRGDLRFTLLALAVALPCVVLPGAYAAARWGGLAGGGALSLLVAAGGEVFYRGFLLFGLERRFGAFPAAALTAMLFAAARAPSPIFVGPVLAGGFLLAYLGLRTRSLLAPAAITAAVAALVSLFSAY